MEVDEKRKENMTNPAKFEEKYLMRSEDRLRTVSEKINARKALLLVSCVIIRNSKRKQKYIFSQPETTQRATAPEAWSGNI